MLQGLLLGLATGAFSAPSGEWGSWLPGLIFAANFLPWKQLWWRKLGATAVSLGAWMITRQGASAAAHDGFHLSPQDQLLFWAQWGALGAVLLGAGLLALGFFQGKRRYWALPLLALCGAVAAQAFGDLKSDRDLYFGFLAWQGSIAAVLGGLTQTSQHHDL